MNGAGKTTTLSILTDEISCTSGDVYIDGKVLTDKKTKELIGYCPQVDPLLDLMNGYETLRFYGKIRGITDEVLDKRIVSLIDEIGLKKFAYKPCGTYSGGNKRLFQINN